MNDEEDDDLGEYDDRDAWERELHEESLHSNDNAAEEVRRKNKVLNTALRAPSEKHDQQSITTSQ